MPNEEFVAFGPVAPYSFPLPVPPVDPDATLTQCVEFNMAFLPYILGGLAPLLLPEAWDTDDVNEKLLAIARIDHLRYLLMNPELCTSSSLCLTLAQIMQDAEGNLALFVAGLLAKTLESCGEFIKEQLESIISLDAIMGFFFGTSADMAEFASVLPEYGVEAVLPQYRLNGCAFEVSFDDGTTWVPQFEFTAEACPALVGPQGMPGPQGSTGATGATGAKGDPGSPGNYIPPDTTADNTDSVRCAVALRACELVFNVYDDNITELNFGGNEAGGAAVVVGVIAAACFALAAAPFIAIGAAITGLVSGLLNVGATAAAAALENADRDVARQNLYCTLKAQGKVNIDDSVLADWKAANVASNIGIASGQDLLSGTIDAIPSGSIKQAGVVGSLSPDPSCAAAYTCPEDTWCFEYNSATGLSTWTGTNTSYSGGAWHAQQFSGFNVFDLRKEFTGLTHLTRVEVHKVNQNACNCSENAFFQINDVTQTMTGQCDAGARTMVWTGDVTATKLYIRNDRCETFDSYVDTIKLSGTGSIPAELGSSNC